MVNNNGAQKEMSGFDEDGFKVLELEVSLKLSLLSQEVCLQ